VSRRDASGVAFDGRLVRRLWTYVGPHQRWVWLGLGLLLGTSAVGLLQPWILKLAIDRYIVPGELAGFGWILLAYAAAALLELAGRGVQSYVVDLAGQNALLDLRMALFARLQRYSAAFYDRTPIGKLIGRVTTDVEALQEMFASGVVTILGDLVNLLAILCVLLWLDWKLTLVTLLVVPPLLFVTLGIRRLVREAYRRMVAVRSRLNAYLHESASGMPILQAFRREESARQRYDELNGELKRTQLRSVKWESILSAATDMLGSMTMALVLWYGGGLALRGLGLAEPVSAVVGSITLGTLVAFVQYMDRFFEPLNELSQKYTVMQSAMSASDRIFALMDREELLPEAAHPATPTTVIGRISFREVVFGYDPEEPVLRNVSFEVSPGEHVAFVGATGAGKSTVLKLLTRLYDLQGGSIELDGVDLREYSLGELRSRVGIVPQDVFLFGGDLLSNIRLGHPEISDEEALRAAEELHLGEVVRRFPGGYREPVRERGSNLSTGERQLVAFARVLAVAPPILALDEATSSVDTEMERLLQEAVGKVMEGRTSLLGAHRRSTIRDVDRILVFHRGQVVEEGSHEELIARRGTYWRLVQLQFSDDGDDRG